MLKLRLIVVTKEQCNVSDFFLLCVIQNNKNLIIVVYCSADTVARRNHLKLFLDASFLMARNRVYEKHEAIVIFQILN